jgi:GMP synthase (glutamine-hydrolysing)
MVAELKEKVQDDKVVLDFLASRLYCSGCSFASSDRQKSILYFFVNNGLLRKNEFAQVLDQYKGMGLNVKALMLEIDFVRIGRS